MIFIREMKRTDLKSLIRECLNEALADQQFDDLRGNISSRTEIGEKWSQTIWALEGLYDQVKSFESLYPTGMSSQGKPANMQEAVKRIEQVVALLQSAKPTILSMDTIQRKDTMA